ncbi:MAG: DNA polymerase IV [Oscillospiraceae bacterium]|jgi:DNA polymerase-4|nr:DNA polymerase IV [Oscillospiraceae bacterium]
MSHDCQPGSDRIIFHCDCDSFFASVEETFHPEYKKIPMAVAGDPESRRGIILAKNQLAKGFGVKTAETIWSAKQKCPDLVLAPPRHHTYGEFCVRINAIYADYTDQVERFSVDESWLDVTGSLHIFGQRDAVANCASRLSPMEQGAKLAHAIRRRVQRETGVTISIGVSWNKIFAKVASDINKPNNICVVTRENYRDVIWSLPVRDLFGVGHKAAEELHRHYIRTIGDLAAADEKMLRRLFGKMGGELHSSANGLDESPVKRIGEEEPVKSVGNGLTFKRDLISEHDIRTGVIALADSVALRLRRHGLKCMTVQVTIKDSALKSIQRQKTTSHPTQLAAALTETAMELIKASWSIGKPIRMLTITAGNLVPEDEAVEQLSLFGEASDAKAKKTEKLEQAMDQIRGKYGKHSIQPGVILGNDLGIRDSDETDEKCT